MADTKIQQYLGTGRRKTAVARVRDPEFFEKGQASQTGVMGIDFVIDPDRAMAESIAQTIEVPGAVSVEYFSEGRLALVEIIIGESSPLVGVPLADRDCHRCRCFRCCRRSHAGCQR